MRRRFALALPAFLLAAVALTSSFQALAADAPATATAPEPPAKKTRTLGIVLYPRFELLDAYGPAEVFGNLQGRLKVVTVAQKAGAVPSTQGPQGMADYGFDDCPPLDLVLVPGGFGTLAELKNEALLQWLRKQGESAEIVMSVCTGSTLLAQAGLLDGRKATSNKQYFKFATDRAPQVQWVKQARWVDDGNRVTSSGVSAGIDMSLHVIERLWGVETAERIANATEYQWHREADVDPFAKFAK
jgi:transcriptional regulator GlxA family with amidase domain